ncbi:MAG: GrpB family protein [Carbonactinosporaceae bacterium]
MIDLALGDILGEPRRDRVAVVPYDVHWPLRFGRIRDDLARALGPVARRVDHIGSTAIPGMAARPAIDVQVSVEDLDAEEDYRPAFESLGWTLRGREPSHRYFRAPPGQPRDTHIYVCASGTAWEYDHLLLVAYLQTHPERRDAYARLKLELGARRADDSAAYCRERAGFIEETIRFGQGWARETGWRP